MLNVHPHGQCVESIPGVVGRYSAPATGLPPKLNQKKLIKNVLLLLVIILGGRRKVKYP